MIFLYPLPPRPAPYSEAKYKRAIEALVKSYKDALTITIPKVRRNGICAREIREFKELVKKAQKRLKRKGQI